MNPSKYKSISMRKNAWELATSLSKSLVPNLELSRSQVVEIALERMSKDIGNIEFVGKCLNGFSNSSQTDHPTKCTTRTCDQNDDASHVQGSIQFFTQGLRKIPFEGRIVFDELSSVSCDSKSGGNQHGNIGMPDKLKVRV